MRRGVLRDGLAEIMGQGFGRGVLRRIGAGRFLLGVGLAAKGQHDRGLVIVLRQGRGKRVFVAADDRRPLWSTAWGMAVPAGTACRPVVTSSTPIVTDVAFVGVPLTLQARLNLIKEKTRARECSPCTGFS